MKNVGIAILVIIAAAVIIGAAVSYFGTPDFMTKFWTDLTNFGTKMFGAESWS